MCSSVSRALSLFSAASVLLLWTCAAVLPNCPLAGANTGLFPRASLGAPLPLPREWRSGRQQWAVAARAFRFAVAPSTPSCPILADALSRYYALTFPDLLLDPESSSASSSATQASNPNDMPLLSQLEACLLS